jgi:hypothetical protein
VQACESLDGQNALRPAGIQPKLLRGKAAVAPRHQQLPSPGIGDADARNCAGVFEGSECTLRGGGKF